MSEKHPGGRPEKYIDKELLEKLMQYNFSLNDTAFFFKVSSTTIGRFINTEYGLSFDEFRDQNRNVLKVKLIDKAIEKALDDDNNIMLIFALKNLCAWADKQELKLDQEKPFVLAYDQEKLKTIDHE